MCLMWFKIEKNGPHRQIGNIGATLNYGAWSIDYELSPS
jgi:hypothetical protein